MPRKLKNIIGEVFERLTVKEYGGLIKNGKSKASSWVCECVCGTIIIVTNNNLRRGITRSCGCLQRDIVKQIKVDLTGKIFGELTVIHFIRTDDGNAIWFCQCSCGQTCEAASCSLKQNQKKSCGCRQGWWRSERPGLWKNQAEYSKWRREDPIHKLRNSVSNSIRGMLKHNGSYKRKKSIRNFLPYTIEDLKKHLENKFESWMNWSNHGGKSNDENKSWHIDHIIPHSKFPYKSMTDPLFLECWALENLQPLEKSENFSKGCKYFSCVENLF